MYLKHFGLSEFPFNLTPDTQFYVDMPSHIEALNVLLLALQAGEGFIKITGDVGRGKTLLCRKLLNELQSPYITAYIPNPHLSPAGLRMAIADEFGISYTRNSGQSKMLQQINQFLLDAAANKRKPVVIIDEAQAMPLETLESLRLLSNLETEKQKLLHIILFAQPELDTLLQKKSIRQLRQRISFSYHLKKLSYSDVRYYIERRLGIAHLTIEHFFTPLAYRAIHFYSNGTPRLINILSNKALLSAYGKGNYKVSLKNVQLAALDTEETANLKHPLECRTSILGLFVFSLFMAGIYI
ncbi:MAG: AAA family ATPase [Piscirickettsiaceae bacterium]|nr:AAA family ATPase [Piscirickettsiaceae bacterium]